MSSRSAQVEIKFMGYQEQLALRSKILKPHLTPLECVNPGDLREESFHLGAFKGDTLLGIAAFEKEDHPGLAQFHSNHSDLDLRNGYRLRGMGVLPEYRRYGLGAKLVRRGEEIIADHKGKYLWFNARQIAFPFYEALGFQYFSDFFDIPMIGPHRVMYRVL